MSLVLPPALDLPGYRLARWQVAHAEALRAALTASDAHLRAWTPWVIDGRVPGLTLEERLSRHESDFVAGREWVYGLFSPDGAEVLGGCGLYPRVGPGAMEIGYWLAAGQTGRGLATDAARVLTGLAFTAPGIDRVEIRVERRNVASARVPRRLGYELAGSTTAHGAPDLMVWQVTRGEYLLRSGPPTAP